MSSSKERESIQPASIEVRTLDGTGLGFSNLPEALVYCSRDKGQYYSVESSLEMGIQGRLIPADEGEMLELTIRGRTWIVPRAGVERSGITVSTNYDFKKWFNLCLRIYEYDDPVFDRGIFWIAINDSTRAKLKFGLRPNHPSSVAELIERSSEGEKKVIQILNDALNGIYPEE